jgi:hypothetical protein
MKHTVLLSFLFFIAQAHSQQDTVFVTHSGDSWGGDSLNYVTDTVLFDSGVTRHILTGTAILPYTSNQIGAFGAGLYFDNVDRTDCQERDAEVAYHSKDNINWYEISDSTLTVNFNLYDNCCYDFLCDISVDSSGTLNLIYTGYGTFCGCRCCFGLTYQMSRLLDPDYTQIKALMINGDTETLEFLD